MEDRTLKELKELVEKAKNGDKEAFSLIYQKFFTPLYRYIYFRVGSKEDAEDLIQEVFTKAYLSFSKFKFTGSSPLAYFYTIARNTIIDQGRKKKHNIDSDDDVDSHKGDGDSPEESAAKNEDAKMLKLAIEELTESEQDVIIMKFFDGLSNKEIAEILGKEEGAVRQLQSRGLRDLRDILKKKNEQ
ncbi:MAG: sigma-70 family RNA polymerase sigma factor [Candidatus Paceibacterota bacterium]|jgi:RNA polymerase sigma-70 factor (ECF subfamily)